MMQRSRLLPVVVGLLVLTSCSDSAAPVSPEALTPAAAAFAAGQPAAAFSRASAEVLALPGTVFADFEETSGRLRFGIEHERAEPAVRQTLARLGIQASAYDVEVTEPIHFVASLQDQWDPTEGGVQIGFQGFVCTLGFNADDGSERSLVTASHCSRRQGATDGTAYYQASRFGDGSAVATEVEDAKFFRGGDCPRGRKCRYSDATRALYAAGAASTRGAIAKTAGPNDGSIDVTGSFAVTAQDNVTTDFAVGTTVNKIGRTTGWTQGNVTASCVDVNVFASNITLLCQTFVRDPGEAQVVGGGDSGAGVFRITGGNNVDLIGLLWGGNESNTEFIFSPLKLIRDELGGLIATN
jgi:hypothetical protein